LVFTLTLDDPASLGHSLTLCQPLLGWAAPDMFWVSAWQCAPRLSPAHSHIRGSRSLPTSQLIDHQTKDTQSRVSLVLEAVLAGQPASMNHVKRRGEVR